MKFKKDYINFVIYRAVYGSNGDFRDSTKLRTIADKIISVDDVVKLTFLVGKTAGLESLFKYLLYISDKIDKSQVSIFNLKDNFEYDLRNVIKICRAINDYIPDKPEEKIDLETDVSAPGILDGEDDEKIRKSVIKTGGDEEEEIIDNIESAGKDQDGMTLIENYESLSGDGEVFELESISESVENSEKLYDNTESTDELDEETIQQLREQNDNEEESEEVFELETLNSDVEAISTGKQVVSDTPEEIFVQEEPAIIEETFVPEEPAIQKEPKTSEPEIEIEVIKPISSDVFNAAGKGTKEESVTNDAYYNFETKFFEEVKILEKLFATVERECRNDSAAKLNDKTLQCLTEIIEISSELSSLSRQLMFDLIADVFFTMNLYFTKAISSPDILESEKIKLFDSSLALVNSLIKGEDYLNYDSVVEKLEKLKKLLKGEKDETFKEEDHIEPSAEKEETGEKDVLITDEYETEEKEIPRPYEPDTESAVFKLKYIIKEFEKSFTGISNFSGEYSKFEALDKVGELNNALRLIAKISSSVRLNDVLKLAEVTYVFLKYIKDYRMDMLEAEIQQIIKYIIFTFKMLLTNRKPDDFSVLVQHLNNPVKIFADS
jgi:hypothetical protein